MRGKVKLFLTGVAAILVISLLLGGCSFGSGSDNILEQNQDDTELYTQGENNSAGLRVYIAKSGKYFLRSRDLVYFGSEMSILPEDSIDNYAVVDIPVFTEENFSEGVIQKLKYKLSEDKKTLGYNIFGRGNVQKGITIYDYFDYFEKQTDGPIGEFPIGRWKSTETYGLNEGMVITGLTIYRYTDYTGLPLIDQPYQLKENEIWLGMVRTIPR
jgi:hypothetical protein